MLEIGVFGASGRVGKILAHEILECKRTHLSSVYARNRLDYDMPPEVLVTNDMEVFVESCKIIIDFSSQEATRMLLKHALKCPVGLVIGTTGLGSEDFDLMRECAVKMPVLYAANMSEGVALLSKIVGLVSEKLRGYDVEISEMHHRFKKDAPSGTALSLAKSVADARGLSEESFVVGRGSLDSKCDGGVQGADSSLLGGERGLGRSDSKDSNNSPKNAQRQKDEIGILSLRGGDVVGRHTVGFYTDGEYLELTHTATSRATFAKGALSAALWLRDKKPGLYGMGDIFGGIF